ncbi:MAG: T9SS type A sorting domain-containing protein [Bacteroidetes bacterium]|nr:T9SS type A sorting domain-containing protein [Bacteroidota bacterium]
MKRLSLFFISLLMIGITNSFSQVTTVSSSEYGRIFDVVYDQNTQNGVYAASMNNHILVSNDNGVSWEVFYSFSSGYVKELRMVNDTHLSFYLTNANNPEDNSIHLIQLSDLTLTTINRPINNESTDRAIEDYSIYENNIDIMLYKEIYTIGIDNYNRVHYTTNGGQTWTMVYDEISSNLISVDKVLINYNNPNQLFITRGNGANGVNGGFLVSNDAGVNWTEYYAETNIRAVAVDLFDANHWMIGTDPGWGQDEAVYETLDAGANWSQVTIAFDDHWEKAINEVIFHPNIPNKIYVLETNEIAISTDGGATWSVQVYDPFTPSYYFGLSATFNPFNDNEVIYTSNWYPYRSTDGGITIERMYTPYSWVSSVDLSANSGGGQDPYLYYGVQGGLVSKNLVTNSETSYGVQSVDIISGSAPPAFFADNNLYGRIFASVEDFNGKALNVSTDHGQSFETFYTGFWDPVLNIQPDPVNTTDVWVSFDVFSGSGTYIVDVTSSDPWNPNLTNLTMPSSAKHHSTWINPINNQEVLAGLGGEIWSSTDRGTNWTNSSNGLTLDPDLGRIYSIVRNPSDVNEFVLASSGGVWKSTDNCANWTNMLTTNGVRQVVYDPNDAEVLVAATYDSPESSTAIYFSTDSGATWNMIPVEEFVFCNSTSMAFDFTGEGFTVYMATYDLGVITYDVMYDPTGINNPITDFSGLALYPNPVVDVLNVTFENESIPSITVIYNTIGEEVDRFVNQTKFDLSHLITGVYLVKVSNQNGKSFVKRIIKN